jgi:predicted DNA-binding protein YlxM (UPF0122 family)
MENYKFSLSLRCLATAVSNSRQAPEDKINSKEIKINKWERKIKLN